MASRNRNREFLIPRAAQLAGITHMAMWKVVQRGEIPSTVVEGSDGRECRKILEADLRAWVRTRIRDGAKKYEKCPLLKGA